MNLSLRPVTRRTLGGLLAGGLFAASSAAPAAAAPAGPSGTLARGSAAAEPARETPPGDKLGARDRDLLAAARAKRVEEVTLIVATAKGATADVRSRVQALGGRVEARNDQVGYVRAAVPPAAVIDVAALAKVRAVDLDEVYRVPDPRPERGRTTEPAQAATVPAPGPGTPDDNPYLPTAETGAVAFKEANPAYDGRGITIGIMDTGVDLDHPALQTTSTGERKIVDWVTATGVLEDQTWRPMTRQVTGPTFDFRGATWTAPEGTFAVDIFVESVTAGSEPAGDVNRDGDTTDVWGILYDPATNDVRVDVDQDRDFTDEPVMRPYRERFQVGHFGTDDPATAVREQMPFVVEFREDVDLSAVGRPPTDFVNIGLVEGAHGSHVAGIAAGNALFGGAMDGAAPGAKIVSSRACNWGGGCTAVALVEGMIDLVVNRDVDVVNMSIGGLPSLNDGANARAVLYNTLIRDFGVQLFLSAGNSGPGVNTVGDPSVATDVVSVASSISKATWQANYGSYVTAHRKLHNFSSRGPREDGGFKPNVAAPGAAVSTVPLWQEGAPVPEAGYPLPPGYAMFNGTSMAAPQAAGAAALLLSAAAATAREVAPAELRRAMYSGARFITGTPAFGQGNGQVYVPGAWELLAAGPLELRTYEVSAPVCTPIWRLLGRTSGSGIYNRCTATEGGHRPGQAKTYDVTITRTSGPAGGLSHDLRWLGNYGMFSAPGTVDLPLGVPTTVPVTARPGRGAFGAVLRIDDPATRGVDAETMNVVVGSTDLAAPAYAMSVSAEVQRNRTVSYFLTVPEGAAALQVDLSALAPESQTRFIGIHPYGVPLDSTSSLACYTNFSDPGSCNPLSRAYEEPTPGVWEIEVESRRTSPLLANPFTLTAVVQGVAVEPATQQVPLAPGQVTPVQWTAQNRFGAVTVQPLGGTLGAARIERPSIGRGETQRYTVAVPSGASQFDVRIGNPSDLGADLDLTVRKDGVLVGRDADGDSEESVTVTDPAPGTYSVEVFAFDVPAGSTAYDYRDVYFAPSLGTLSVPSAALTLAPGQRSRITGEVRDATSVDGRQILGELQLVTPAGARVGRATVLAG